MQAIYIMETIMEHVAIELSMDPLVFRELNLYKKDQVKENKRFLQQR